MIDRKTKRPAEINNSSSVIRTWLISSHKWRYMHFIGFSLKGPYIALYETSLSRYNPRLWKTVGLSYDYLQKMIIHKTYQNL